MSLEIRLEESDDRDVVLEVERLAFGSDEEPAIVATIRGEEGSFAMVAVEDEEVVGRVQFSRAWVGEGDFVIA